ncbi:MAG: hypothetical protein ABIF71_05900 [Planctomycetota bacterium]
MKITCPKCGSSQDLTADMVNTKWRCSDCGQKIKVNAPSENPPIPAVAPEPKLPSKAAAPEPKPAPAAPARPQAAMAAGSGHASARKRAIAQQTTPEGDAEGTEAKPSGVPANQAVYMIGGFVVVVILFVAMASMRHRDTSGPGGSETAGRVAVPERSPLEVIEEKVRNAPDDAALRAEAARLWFDKGREEDRYRKAYGHARRALDIKGDMRLYAIAVECALELDLTTEAENLSVEAAKLAPKGMEPIRKIFAADLRCRDLEEPQARAFEGMAAALELIKEGDRLFKQGQEDNPKFHEAALKYEESLATLEKAQAAFPYNQWLERRMEHVNQNLMWSNKLFRAVTDKDRAMWKDGEKAPAPVGPAAPAPAKEEAPHAP